MFDKSTVIYNTLRVVVVVGNVVGVASKKVAKLTYFLIAGLPARHLPLAICHLPSETYLTIFVLDSKISQMSNVSRMANDMDGNCGP